MKNKIVPIFTKGCWNFNMNFSKIIVNLLNWKENICMWCGVCVEFWGGGREAWGGM